MELPKEYLAGELAVGAMIGRDRGKTRDRGARDNPPAPEEMRRFERAVCLSYTEEQLSRCLPPDALGGPAS